MPVFFFVVSWAINFRCFSKGTKNNWMVVKFFVPLLWIVMIGLLKRGLTLEQGIDGFFYLFTPNFE